MRLSLFVQSTLFLASSVVETALYNLLYLSSFEKAYSAVYLSTKIYVISINTHAFKVKFNAQLESFQGSACM